MFFILWYLSEGLRILKYLYNRNIDYHRNQGNRSDVDLLFRMKIRVFSLLYTYV